MKQGESVASRRRIGPLAAFIGATAVTGEDFSGAGEVEISINDRDYAAAEGTFGEIGDGYYYYNPTANECRERGFIVVKLDGVCDEFTLREDIEPSPQGIPVATTGAQDLHVGPLYASLGGSPVIGEDFGGAGEIEVSINGAAWTAAGGRTVEMSDGYYDYIPAAAEVAEVGWLAVKINGVCEEFVIRSTIIDRPGVTVGVATAATIRDRIAALIASRTPTILADDKFRAFRNELAADFRDWAEKNAPGCFRRFQVRETEETGPDVSSIDIERVRVTFEIVIAYPQTHRYGADNAMDRDDCINADWLLLNAVVGIYSRGQYSGAYDCTPLGATKTRETGEGCDFLTVEAEFEYVRATGV